MSMPIDKKPESPAPPRAGLGETAKRVLVGVVGVPAIAAIVWVGDYPLFLLALAILTIGTWELFRMASPEHSRLHFLLTCLIAGGACVVAAFPEVAVNDAFPTPPYPHLWWGYGVMVLMLLMAVVELLHGPNEGATHRMGTGLLAYAWPGLMTAHLLALRGLDNGLWWLLLTVGIIWSCDTAAYFTGRAIGRTKFAPRISPKKTWEGVAGGLVGGIAFAVGVGRLMPLDVSLGVLTGAGFLLCWAGIAGDLLESRVKRDLGWKDSSHLIPGHGGILDRFDALWFGVTVCYYLALGVG